MNDQGVDERIINVCYYYYQVQSIFSFEFIFTKCKTFSVLNVFCFVFVFVLFFAERQSIFSVIIMIFFVKR